MTPKQIIYTAHAKQRLKGRNIRRQEIRWLLARGIREPMELPYHAIRGHVGKDEIRVIYTESSTDILVVTVMWITKRHQEEG
jgi:hypothetical protein